MDDMTPPAHAKPGRRDLLWVLTLIAACGLLEVWASWLQIGSVSGFPKLGSMTTGWILPVTTEAYWTAALYAWLVAPAGPRSKLFAMWSAAGVFLLSLAGQESDHLLAAAHRTVPPVGVVGFVTALPLISVALVAILIHLRQKDREEAEKVERSEREAAQRAAAEANEAGERAALTAELEAARAELEPVLQALSDAERRAAESEAKADQFAAKLAAEKAKRARAEAANGKANGGRGSSANGKANAPANAEPDTQVPDDFDARTEALGMWLANPKITGKELGEAVGLTARWGQLRKAEFATAAASGQAPEE